MYGTSSRCKITDTLQIHHNKNHILKGNSHSFLGTSNELLPADFVLLETLKTIRNTRQTIRKDLHLVRLREVVSATSTHTDLAAVRTTMTPVRSQSVSLLYNCTPTSLFSGGCELPRACTSRLLSASFFFSAGILSSSTRMSVPPGASASYASTCVSASEIASKTYSTGFPPVIFWISERIADAGSERSSTSVAPSDLRRSSLCGDAVVMMGEYPESLATWIAEVQSCEDASTSSQES